jgi:hypothetical protein
MCVSLVVNQSVLSLINIYLTGDGKQGFQTPIVEDTFMVDGIGALGNLHSERGLTYIEVVLSGHMYVSCFSCLLECLPFVQGSPILTMVGVPEYAVFDGIQADAVKLENVTSYII